MNKRFLSSLTLSLSLLATTSFTAFAKDINTKAITEKPSPQTTNIESIIVTFPNNVEFDAGGKKQRPVVLRIVEPVYNNAGKVVIPASSRVEAVLVPVGKGKDKGTMIFAKSLIMNGKSYPLSATGSTTIPARKITKRSRLEQAQKYGFSVSRFSPVYSTFTGGTESQEMIRNTLLMQGVGAIIGYLSPRSKLASRIPEGSEHILHLQKTLSLDTTQNTPVIANNSSKTQEYSFAFRDQGQYNKLLKKVITAYNQKEISQTQAYKILETANKYVKTQVNPRLYPQDNLRKQVSKLIGFNYAID